MKYRLLRNGGIPFVLIHIAAACSVFVGFTTEAVVCCAVLYVVRMFGITAGYHRYFAHRTYKTSRVMQFALGWLASSSAQKGVLWWAGHHRTHHKHSDTERDVHSPVRRGFWYSHVGWFFDYPPETDWDRVKDLSGQPELVWLNRWHLVPPTILALSCLALFGWSGLFVGFFLSTVLLWHGTFTINSLAHVAGRKRYATGDESRNNALLALITLGEGWHNNHHHYPSSTRQGFYWWELDVSWLVLRAMERVGLVWGLREPPLRIRDDHTAKGCNPLSLDGEGSILRASTVCTLPTSVAPRLAGSADSRSSS